MGITPMSQWWDNLGAEDKREAEDAEQSRHAFLVFPNWTSLACSHVNKFCSDLC